MKRMNVTLLISTLIALALLVACGGGSSNGSISPTSDNDISTSSSVNGDLTGRLFIGGDNDGWIMDFSTGKYTRIPGVDWEREGNGIYLQKADYKAYPVAYDGSEFVVTVKDCQETQDTAYPLQFDDCVAIHKEDGSKVDGEIRLIQHIWGVAKISRNRQYIAFIHNDNRFSFPNDTLLLADRNGKLIVGDELPDDLGRSLDWLPDGELVYAHDQTIYLTGPYDTKGTPIVTFPKESGFPTQLAVSPDGKQLAFTLVTHTSITTVRGTTWIMNIDGSGLRKLTDIPMENDPTTTIDDPIINYPTWSPDGKWILVVAGYVAPLDDTNLGVPGGLYVVPSDGHNVTLTNEGDSPARRVLSYYKSTAGHTNPELTSEFSTRGSLAWLP